VSRLSVLFEEKKCCSVNQVESSHGGVAANKDYYSQERGGRGGTMPVRHWAARKKATWENSQ